MGRAVTVRTRRRKNRGAPKAVIVLVAVGLVVVLGWALTSMLGGDRPAPDAGTGGAESTASRGMGPEAGGKNSVAEGREGIDADGGRNRGDRIATLDDPGVEAILDGAMGTGEERTAAPRGGGLLAGAIDAELIETPNAAAGDVRADATLPEVPAVGASDETGSGNDSASETVLTRLPEPEGAGVPSPDAGTERGTVPRENRADEVDAVARADRVLANPGVASDADLLGAREAMLGELASARRAGSLARTLAAKDRVARLNAVIVFSDRVVDGDAMTSVYRVKSGDSLARIARRANTDTHWRLIQRVNGLANPNRIRVGQRLKLVTGPFHAVVQKGSFTMDVYHGPSESPGQWSYVRSFRVGLGEGGSTPTGTFVVSANKLENPGWVNPRDSRERYDRDDPNNPIGEYWLGLDGVGSSVGVTGYGIHGTIEPDSIGTNASMGCVRLVDGDVEFVYELLEERVSVVHIVD